jgi:hypothetical protein
MAKRKYVNVDAIRQKIDQLFEYRKLNDLIRLGGLEEKQEWIGHLIRIQTQIYHLDAYLESTWELDKRELESFWEAIRSSLSQLGYEKKEAGKMLKEIKRYERIEKDCRRDKWPTRIPLRKFYTTKSCDVRLMRHLIYDASPGLRGVWKENTWKYYDLITEINDDVSDVGEDLLTYNGNRYLISLLRKGVYNTTDTYKTFVKKVTEKADRFFKKHPKQELDHQLHDWIRVRSGETLKLLEHSQHMLDGDLLAKSLVLQHMD